MMINQRCRNGRSSYRPPDEVINTFHYEIAPIESDSEAKAFVRLHHYAHSFPAARYRFGLYHRSGDLVGVAVFSHPCNNLVLTNIFPGDALESCELGRLVLLDSVPGNGESFFVSRCFHHLKHVGIIGVVSFSDPVPRTTAGGDLVHVGHTGTVYQALSSHFLGRATPRTLRLLPDGTVFNERSAQKIRSEERGWESAARRLELFGAPKPPQKQAARKEWLNQWQEKLTRRIWHEGNFKYAWGLERSTKRALPPSLPYPKLTRAQLALWEPATKNETKQ
jgi:hypothetical protein